MARIGVSKPLYCLLEYQDGADRSDPSTAGWLGKATSFDISVDNASDNDLYADNRLQETDNQFGGGTLTIGVDDLRDEAALDVLGLTKVGSEAPYELVHKSGTSTPFFSLGGVVKLVRSGVTSYMAVMLQKVQFTDPGISATTQGETIDWQTPELTATILERIYDPDEEDWPEANTGWLVTKQGFSTENDAALYIFTEWMGGTAQQYPPDLD